MKLRLALIIAFIASINSPAMSADKSVIMRELTGTGLSQKILRYKYPGPLRSAEIDFNFGGDHPPKMDSIEIKFGNGKNTQIPSAVIACFPNTRESEAYLLTTAPDKHFPTLKDNFWVDLVVPFGPKPVVSRNSDDDPTAITILTHPCVSSKQLGQLKA